MNRFTLLVWIGACLITAGIILAIAYAADGNETNATSAIRLGDDWSCGYILPNTTLEDIRDCYRD